MSKIKMLPYGISDFVDLREKNRYFVDKSMYIPKLERACDYLFLIRPRRFGKSVFLSMVREYYDIESQDRFDELFDGLWIKEHPTELKGKFQVMYFDFSQVASGKEDLQTEFYRYCSNELVKFARKYAKYYPDYFVNEVLEKAPDAVDQLRYICGEAKMKRNHLYLILDEYDNFTNDVLSEKGQAVYHALTHATGFYRNIFKLFKPNFSHILMMGVSPVTLDDLTSGFNIAINITMDEWFNMALGLSETEVRAMIQYYKDAGLIKDDVDNLIDDMRPWYDNYCFAEKSYGVDPSMFNCDMVIYYLRNCIEKGCPPKDKLDVNTRTDYKKLKRLLELEEMGDHERSILHEIAANESIYSTINSSFPADCIYDNNNFISLLYYYGMLTITGMEGAMLKLSIPNNNVRKQYYEYLLDEYRRMAPIDFMATKRSFYQMAVRGNWRPTMEKIAGDYGKLSSVRSAIEGERNVQGFVLCALSLCPYYITAPEVELAHGYCDFYLLPDKMRWPETVHSYIIELKYLTEKATEEAARKQWDEAVAQIRHYATDKRVIQLSKDTELHLIIMQIRNFKLERLEEVDG